LGTIIASLTKFIDGTSETETNLADIVGSAENMENQQDMEVDEATATLRGAEDASSDTAPAGELDGGGLIKVLKAFRLLAEEFNGKFKAMWA
jgi:hypothetical protein